MSHARSEYEDFKAIAPDVYDVVLALGQFAAKAGLDKQLLELVKLRASQITMAAPSASSTTSWSRSGSACPSIS